MKVRNGFVSNSSSSSFIINKKDLSNLQLFAIKNHIEYANHISMDNRTHFEDDAWLIDESDEVIRGSTYMDNFSMSSLLRAISVTDIDWRE